MKSFNHIQEPSPLSKRNAIILILTYFLGYILLFPLILVLIDQFIIPGFYAMPYTDVLFHTTMTLIVLYLGSKLLHESNQHWSIMALYIPIIAAMVMLWGSILIGVIITTLSGQSEPNNQALLYTMFKENKLMIMVQALVFAPVVEEIIFRGVLYRHFKKTGHYLIPLLVSTLLFASMHSLNAIISGQWSDLWYLPLYAFMSLVLTYTYEMTHNLYSSILLHFINNLISILAMFYAIQATLK